MSQYVPCQECGRIVNRYLDSCPYCSEDPGADRSDRPEWMNPEAPASRKSFQPIVSVALFLQLLFGLFIVASIVAILTAISYRADLLDVVAGASISSEAVLSEERFNAASVLASWAYVATAVTFIVWFSRVYSNLTYLGRVRRRRPVWAVGSWFIPVAGMVIPYGIGAEIWTQSKPKPGPVNERRDPNMEPVISWWALFLMMSLVNVVEALILPADYNVNDLAAYVGVDIVSSVVSLGAAIAAMRFVRRATGRQEKLHVIRQSGLTW
ncbi:MAG: DUF4328 domain-containing protein [bacterium]|nr:DUF4328 domain-containing protein [bacterium]